MENKSDFISKRLRLGYTREMAEAEWEEFNRIDKMTMSELNAEMTDKEKKSLKSATKGAKSDKAKREYKPREKDKEKLWLIDTICKNLSIYDFEQSEFKIKNVQIVNDVKEITFTVGENEYSLSLIKHRKPKN